MGFGLLLRLSPMENINAPTVVILDQEKTKIGRKSEIRMDTSRGKEVSKHHTTIYRKTHHSNEVWIIEDNDSLNGTFVNGKKIHRVILNHGDEVVFGGGSAFLLGDIIASTELAECRYVFYLALPPVKFVKTVDLNASLLASDLMETCAICYCPCVAAETLPCGHRFCLSCIHEWCRVCHKNMRPCVCPMCRAAFASSELTPEEAQRSNSEIKVYSMEPMLRDLEVKSCKQIKKVNIFKKWTNKHAEVFASYYSKVKKSETRLPIFLHLTKATLSHAFHESNENLKNAICNLGGNPDSDERNKLILQFLLLLYKTLVPKPQVVQNIVSSKQASARHRH